MAKVRLLNGKPLMVGGKVALSDDCCCAQGCSCCPPATATIDVTFSGVGDVGACKTCVLSGHTALVSVSTLNTTFTLPIFDDMGASCVSYQNLSAGTITSTLCDEGLGTATINMTLSVAVTCYNPGDGCRWTIIAGLDFRGLCPLPFIGICDCSLTAFYCDAPVAGPFNNQCSGVFANCVSTGGAATFS